MKRRSRVLVLCAAGALMPGMALPAQTVGGSATAASGAMPAARGSQVRYENGILTVAANGASLNGLLREIAQRTGMHVSGSVGEDRVWGTYGPAEPSRVISLLLDGTGSNVLLVQGADDRPRELVLTRRTGGVTPPDPNAAARADADDANANADDDAAPANVPQRNRFGGGRAIAPGYRPPTGEGNSAAQQVGGQDRNPAAANGTPSSTEQPVVFPAVDPTTPPSTASSTPTDNVDSTPKDAKTPQQIFEELQRLRQQQQPTAPTTPQQ